jgi:NAD(P)-dependent dehydrogenase (short-subunit alcohol dehydrogenase family)
MRIIVTGGNSGVGKATAAELAAAGHNVVIACRTIPKAELAAAEMAGNVEVCHLDLADLASVRKFADSVDSVDVLMNNAGLRASVEAVTTDLPSGSYLAPRFNQWGKPKLTNLRRKARDPVVARRLWDLSAELTHCNWREEVPQRIF